MESIRPLLLQSPRTPNTQEFVPAMHVFPELPKSKSSSSNTVTFAEIDSSNPIENSSNSEASWSLKKSSSRRSNTSVHSGSSGSTKNSVKEVSRSGSNSVKEVSRSGSKSVRYGSQGADSDGLSMSQKELSDEDARLVYVNDPDRTNERFEFSGNSIRTTKYSILTFIPRNLFEQFHRVAYIYFLIIAILNQLPQLAVFGGVVSVLPLAFVLIVTAVKDAYEDWRRHRADKVENNRLASVSVNGELIEKKWKDIRVGEIIKIKANESIPCDIVLLSTSDPTGVAYVQTINLDGESNLKTRYAKQETHSEKGRFNGLIKCEKPNRNIYGFQANMEIDGKRLSLGSSNIVLRGCEVKNTSWALGVAVYCGGETKAMLNSSGAPSKRSRLETRMNSEIIMLSFFLIALCTVTSVCAAVWLKRHKDELDLLPYYRKLDFSEGKEESYKYYGWGFEVLFTFLMSVIVFQVMIPISLYISMELVRVGQAYFMIGDNNMYDEATKSRFQCRALNINEDLGQIKYVFSDKTGTLTENKMEFRCSSIYGVDYSSTKAILEDEKVEYSVVDGKVLRPKMQVKVNPELFQLSRSGLENTDGKQIHDFFLALAACNTIVPLVVDTSDPDVKLIDYQGESPDEQALAYAAAAYGFTLIERTSGHIIIDIQGERQRFNVLGMHEFDSDRKRMSVILGYPDNSVKLFVKGADTSMLSVKDKSFDMNIIRETETHLHSYSTQGLRTLVIGIRELNTSEFEQWHAAFETASAALFGRGATLRKVASNIERNICILGATAIEDKLQQGVPEAIESLRTAGIKVWVLTGDKQETAISIGYSSKLLTRNMTQITINSNNKESSRRKLKDAIVMTQKLASTSEGSSDSLPTLVALVIDGTSLVHILDSKLEEQLFQLASRCSVVLCCRVAPLQKAGIVSLVKKRTSDMTLAIGDGANDVSMIQMADVGVGISGQEGRQAVMASDFAMGQFRFLVPLLLIHGHWNYQRLGYMILYNFYRNAVLVLVLFWYVLFTAFTSTTAINEWSSTLYSIIYTSLPTIVVGILDKDLSKRTLLKHPQLYGAGQRHEAYNKRLFLFTMVDTLWQSLVIFWVPLFAYWSSTIDISSIGDLWTLAVVILVNLHLAMDVGRWSWVTHVSIWGSIVATFLCVMIIDAIPSLFGYWAFFHAGGTALFWLCLLGIMIAALLPRFAVKFVYQYYFPTDIQISREAEKVGIEREVEGGGQIEMLPISDGPSR
ncbi:PREDICTED: phospholipid-transporting ATPase 1-like isoform X2 [Lupinus angustifolius]|uniref:phospholipid-transporting ATPase 1-like isoform X2 n=1 Tax=Lupinus angustifolius TaxID=3871 RepID=UPI00092E54C7|nr:PREDICTED: phospholipid-transporting ATPase 1-like isoform X2 [Lupinus angustifolius]